MKISLIKYAILPMAFAFASGIASTSLAQTWDLAGDFSAAANPNGDWTYGVYLEDSYNSTPFGPFYVWPAAQPWAGSDILYYYGNPGNDLGAGAIFFNQTANDHVAGSQFLRPGEVAFFPAALGWGYAPVIRWTAPSNMVISINALFAGHDEASTDVHVLLNGDMQDGTDPIFTGTHLFDGIIDGNVGCADLSIPQTGASPLQAYNDLIPVSAGDIIDFVVGYGPNHFYGGDMTAVSATIVAANASQWGGDTAGSWNTPGKWTNSTVPTGPGAGAIFWSNNTGPAVVTVDSPVTVGVLSIKSPNSYEIDGPSTITLDNTGGTGNARISVSGNHTIGAQLVQNGPLDIALGSTSDSLILSGGITEGTAPGAISITNGTVTMPAIPASSTNEAFNLSNCTFKYTGATAAPARPVNLAGYFKLTVDSSAANLALGDNLASTAITFYKNGPGTLTLNRTTAGTITLGAVFATQDGTTVLDGVADAIYEANTFYIFGEAAGSNAVMTMTGNCRFNAGALNGNTHIGSGADTTSTWTLSGHAQYAHVGTSTWANSGLLDIGDYGSTAVVTLNDFASFDVPNCAVFIGGNVEANTTNGAQGTLTLNNSATFTAGRAVMIGDRLTTGTLNLNGGVFTAPALVASSQSIASTVNFNGGTLKAAAGNMRYYEAYANLLASHFIDGTSLALNVQVGGAKIDTNGLNVTAARGFQHDPTVGAPAIDGGLTKIGTGALMLYGQSSFTGPTVVNDGTLKLQSNIAHHAVSTADNAAGDRTDGPFSLGRDFIVNADKQIQVVQLGVFDDLGDGLAAAHVVHLYDVVNDVDTPLAFTSGTSETSGTYQRGFRYLTLGTPLTLNPGQYRIWVDTMGGEGNDAFSQAISSLDAGTTGAITFDKSYFGTAGAMPATEWPDVSYNADASFVYYDPSTLITANILPVTTPVMIGGAAGSTPKLDLQGMNQQIASLADVAGAPVKGVVTNSTPSTPVVLTLGATSGTTAYTGAIEGNISLVKNGGGTQSLTGPLTYTGNTTVNAGTLIVSSINNRTGSVTVAGGTLTAGSLRVGTLATGSGASASAVPEPGTLVLLALAALGAGLAWCKRR